MADTLFDLSALQRDTTAPAKSDRRGDTFNAAHGLRGIASLAVFYAHLIGGPAKHIYGSSETYKEAITPYWNFGTFGVCLFFVISGFVILPSALRYSPKEFAGRRFWRINPLFFVCTAIYIVLKRRDQPHPQTNNVVAVVAGLTFTNLLTDTDQITPNAWTLTCNQVFFYAFTCSIVYFALRKPNKPALIIVSLLALVFLWRYPITFYFIGGAVLLLLYNRYDAIREGSGHRVAEVVAAVAMVYLASRGHYNYRCLEFLDPSCCRSIRSPSSIRLALSRNSLTTALLETLGIQVLRHGQLQPVSGASVHAT